MTLWRESLAQVGPRRCGSDRRKGKAFDRCSPDEPSAVGGAVGTDVCGVDRMCCREPGEQFPKICELTRAVEREEPLGLSMCARVVGQHGIALGGEVLLGHEVWRPVDEVRRVPGLSEAVQEHDGRPARSRRGPGGLKELAAMRTPSLIVTFTSVWVKSPAAARPAGTRAAVSATASTIRGGARGG